MNEWNREYAAKRIPAFSFTYFETVDSTSDYLKRGLKENALTLPTVAVARTQTAGRGRLNNRAFFSPPGGLYFSAAIRESDVRCAPELITLGVGVATAQATEKLCGGTVQLKWVNDIIVRGKKAGGILCERVSYGTPAYVIGIGINANKDAVEGFMPEKVGALTANVPLEELLCEILERMLCVLGGGTDILTDYNKRLSLVGKQVTVRHGGSVERACVQCVTADGMVCTLGDGTAVTVRTCADIVSDLYGA